MLRFYPHRKARKVRLEPYREAWHLLNPLLPNPLINHPRPASTKITPKNTCRNPDTEPQD
jgi:hypothetical protein